MKYVVMCTAVAILALLAGCSALGTYRKVTVLLPQESTWDVVGRDSPWYELRWPDRNGELMIYHVPSGVGQIDVFIEKGADIPLSALPYGMEPGAGGWASAYQKGHEVELTWKYGELAGYFLELWMREPGRMQAVQIAYWADIWDHELDRMNTTYNPGIIRMNREEFLIGILTRQFQSKLVEALLAVQVALGELLPGRWYYVHDPEYTFYSEPGNSIKLYVSYPGVYIFFHENRKNTVTIYLDEKGYWHIYQEAQGSFSRTAD